MKYQERFGIKKINLGKIEDDYVRWALSFFNFFKHSLKELILLIEC